MVRASSQTDDPALDAAALLRRIGFFGLFVITPIAAQVSRRALVVLTPIGVVLLVIASAIDGRQRKVAPSLSRLLKAPAFLAGLLVVLWSAVSLVWTPFPGPAAERVANLFGAIGLTLLGYFALPERMRSANLYLLPLGVGAAAVVMALAALSDSAGFTEAAEGDSTLERGAVLLALLAWPAVAWLRSRRRDVEALVTVILVAAALLIAPGPIPLFALAAGAIAFAITTRWQQLGVRITAVVTAGLIALAPVIPFLARPLGAVLFGPLSPGVLSLKAWQKVVSTEPLRLITGHGLESALRGRIFGVLPPNAPTTLLFGIWYELGIVGAFALAFALHNAIRRAGRDSALLAPGTTAAFVTAFAIACCGVGVTVIWWLTSLALAVLVFVAIERGQFRTRRPKVRLPIRPRAEV